jgi:uncharacterized protein
MKPLAALAALTVALASAVTPAFARTSYIVDGAHLLSGTAIAQLDQQIGAFNAQTGKEVVVVTTPSLDGQSADAALERSFAQQQVNGVEIFIAKDERQIRVAGDGASIQFFPNRSFQSIYQAMRPSFAQGNFDQGVETGVSLIINTYLGHASSLNSARQPVGASGATHRSTSGGWSMNWFWWIIILAVIFFVIRGIFRAMSGPRMMPPGYGGPGMSGPGMGGPGMGGPGMGGPGYGPGYGYGGGGGFWSGLLGGLGGAWLGNELFSGRGNFGEGGGYGSAGMVDPGSSADASGWQSDAGQIDTSNIGGGGWGDSGGGFGGGDSGGGFGGGDSGGGGGDSGGGW